MKKKLITAPVAKILSAYPFGSQRDKGLDARVLVKFHIPQTCLAWYVLEATPYTITKEDALITGLKEGVTWRMYGVEVRKNVERGVYNEHIYEAELKRMYANVPITEGEYAGCFVEMDVEREDIPAGTLLRDVPCIGTADAEAWRQVDIKARILERELKEEETERRIMNPNCQTDALYLQDRKAYNEYMKQVEEYRKTHPDYDKDV